MAVLNKDTSSPSTNYIFKQYLNKFSKRDEVTGEWRKLHTEELNDLYCSPNMVRVITSRRMRLAGHVAHRSEERRIQSFGGETRGKETTGETHA